MTFEHIHRSRSRCSVLSMYVFGTWNQTQVLSRFESGCSNHGTMPPRSASTSIAIWTQGKMIHLFFMWGTSLTSHFLTKKISFFPKSLQEKFFALLWSWCDFRLKRKVKNNSTKSLPFKINSFEFSILCSFVWRHQKIQKSFFAMNHFVRIWGIETLVSATKALTERRHSTGTKFQFKWSY